MNFYTYILRSQKDGKFYVGHTSKDPHIRLKEHNQKSTFSTKNRVPFELVYFKEFNTREEAIKLERKFKLTKRGEWRSLV